VHCGRKYCGAAKNKVRHALTDGAGACEGVVSVNTAVTTHHIEAPGETRSETRARGPGWFATLVAGVRWGIEMRRRYDSEVAAGRRPDDAAMRRITAEVDAWLGSRA
jgi:hypothetical protein